jgi:hypothetical protein
VIRSALARIGSAHVLAFLALCVALGSGFAVAAKNRPEPKPTVGYELVSDGQFTQPAGRSNLVSQLVVPQKGLYSVNAKLSIAKAAGNDFADGAVACHLGGSDFEDSAFVTVRRGDIATVSLQSVGGQRKGSGTQAIDLFCEGGDSAYVVSDVKMSAITLDAVKAG